MTKLTVINYIICNDMSERPYTVNSAANNLEGILRLF